MSGSFTVNGNDLSQGVAAGSVDSSKLADGSVGSGKLAAEFTATSSLSPAASIDVNFSSLLGTGPHGRIVKKDIEDFFVAKQMIPHPKYLKYQRRILIIKVPCIYIILLFGLSQARKTMFEIQIYYQQEFLANKYLK